VSSCFFIFLQIEKTLPSSYLATKLENVAASLNLAAVMGGTSGKYIKPNKNWQKINNLAKFCQVRNWLPSSNLAAKFEFGTLH
jgi:hypothetical protein